MPEKSQNGALSAEAAAEYREIRNLIRETGKNIAALAVRHEREMRDLQRKLDETAAASTAKHDREMRDLQCKLDETAAASTAKHDREMRDLRREIGGVGNTQGDIAEDLFRRNFAAAMKKAGIPVDPVAPLKGPREYDIVGINGDCVVVAEVKAKVEESDVARFVKVLPEFRKHYKSLSRPRLYGAMAGLSFKKNAENLAAEEGLFVFIQTPRGGAAVHNARGFEPRNF